jgi:hypothetical protein
MWMIFHIFIQNMKILIQNSMIVWIGMTTPTMTKQHNLQFLHLDYTFGLSCLNNMGWGVGFTRFRNRAI